jgi:hypothetical protein
MQAGRPQHRHHHHQSEHVWYVPVVTRRQEPARLQFFRVLCPPANHQ